jgi:DNA-binding SARP family transcriptional activator
MIGLLNSRTQFESDYKKVQYRLSDAYCTQGLWDKALAMLERVLMYDPYDEENSYAHRQHQTPEWRSVFRDKDLPTFEKRQIEELGIMPSVKFPLEVL